MKYVTRLIVLSVLVLASVAMASDVKNIELSYDNGATVASIYVDGPIRFTHETVDAKEGKPFRVVVDILAAEHKLSAKNFTALPDCPITSIRTSQYSVTPEKVVRFVFDLKKEYAYQIDSKHNVVEIRWVDKSTTPFAKWSAEAPATTSPKPTMPTASKPADKPVEVASINKKIESDRQASLQTSTSQPKAEPHGPAFNPADLPKEEAQPAAKTPTVVRAEPKPADSKPSIVKADPKPSVEKPTTASINSTTTKSESKPSTPKPSVVKAEPKPAAKTPSIAKAEPKPSVEKPMMASNESTPAKSESKPSTPKPSVVKVEPKSTAKAPSIAKAEPKPTTEQPTKAKAEPKSTPKMSEKATPVTAKSKANPSTQAKAQPKPSVKAPNKKAEPAPAKIEPESTEKAKTTSRFRRNPTGPTKIKGTLVAEFPKRLVIKYNSHGRRDPFETLINETKQENNPIERRVPNVEGLRLVGIIEATTGNSALFEDNDSYGYILKAGDKVQKGYVLRVESDRVYFQIFEYGWSRTVALNIED